jgi:hypothetical protein
MIPVQSDSILDGKEAGSPALISCDIYGEKTLIKGRFDNGPAKA